MEVRLFSVFLQLPRGSAKCAGRGVTVRLGTVFEVLLSEYSLINYTIMLNKKIEEALNEQINAEMWSAYLYLSMSAYCHSIGQPGMANWFEIQFQEEQDHAKILFNYVNSRDGRVTLKPIAEVPTEWDGILDVFKSTLKHEQKVTALINKLYALTHEENDFATQSMLKWFIDEQVEEEENAKTIIDNIKMIKDNGYGIYMLDKELGARTYTQASPLSGSAE